MATTDPVRFLDDLNRSYGRLHTAKEDAFWRARMDLDADGEAAQRRLDEREIAWSSFLQDPAQLAAVRKALEVARANGADDSTLVGLRGWERTLASHCIESAAGRSLAAEIVVDEGRLERARGALRLGYLDSSGELHEASSVKLAMMLRSEPDEALRRAAWDGLRSIEPHVIGAGFLDLVRKRNRLARELGAQDYYAWKAPRVEGMTKGEIFARLGELEERTRSSAGRAIAELAARAGSAALRPWNLLWHVAGDLTREQDPYFPFREALRRWGRSFAALGITYRGAQLVLDLVDRPGKYENGFMHGPEVAWRERGRLHRARIHFTANAIPGLVGSGFRATTTLFHEGGHAAHFANIDMPAPCFGQEFAPTSVGFSETQSMLLDSLLSDADWQQRYARDLAGREMPIELAERSIATEQPFAAWSARQMLSVCLGEKALYEIPDAELTPERALAELREVERRMCLLPEGSPRPVLAVPHLLSGDSSAYYHGYVLAEMAVEQTRRHFLERDGHLVDNPRVGPELSEVYWRAGNSRDFDRFVRDMTGAPLEAGALARRLNRTVDEALGEAREALDRLTSAPEPGGPVELDAHLRVVHGNETVAELERSFDDCAEQFARWIDAFPRA
jgi:Peptidase family M3